MEFKWRKAKVSKAIYFFKYDYLTSGNIYFLFCLKAKSNEEDLKRIEKDRLEINAAYDNVSTFRVAIFLMIEFFKLFFY